MPAIHRNTYSKKQNLQGNEFPFNFFTFWEQGVMKILEPSNSCIYALNTEPGGSGYHST